MFRFVGKILCERKIKVRKCEKFAYCDYLKQVKTAGKWMKKIQAKFKDQGHAEMFLVSCWFMTKKTFKLFTADERYFSEDKYSSRSFLSASSSSHIIAHFSNPLLILALNTLLCTALNSIGTARVSFLTHWSYSLSSNIKTWGENEQRLQLSSHELTVRTCAR